MESLETKVRDHLQGSAYKPLKFAQLAKNIGASKAQNKKLLGILNQLEAEGIIRWDESGRIECLQRTKGITGSVRRTSSGDGYIHLLEPSSSPNAGEIVVFAEDMQDARDKDVVLIRLTGRRRFGNQQIAVVVKVLQRATTTFVGAYEENAKGGYVRIDGRQFDAPIALGDPEVGGVRPGDKIVVEMIRFPTQRRSGEAVFKSRLGAPTDLGVDTQSVIQEFALSTDFPEEVLTDARQVAETFDDNDLAGREDLTSQTVITIDPIDARDFDDAISLEENEGGGWTLGVHIADVSHFVQPDSLLDREARSRGNSVYLPGRVLPMLPEILSNGLASLQADRIRLTMSAFLEINAHGEVTSSRFSNSAIRVQHRFAYEQVTQLLQDTRKRPKTISKPVWDVVRRMQKVARVLRARRTQQGAINLELGEVKIDLDRDGRMTGAHLVEGDESHQMIEECMLAANIAVARRLSDAGILYPRRIHPEPTPARLQALREFVKSIGSPMPQLRTQKDLQALLQRVHDTPQEYAVNFALLRSLKQATYSIRHEGHFALAADDYCHFTSPIRRYPDLVVHRLLKQVIAQRKTSVVDNTESLIAVCDHCSQTERRAADAERTLSQVKLLLFLKDKIGMRMSATITGVDRYGFFARGIDLPAEGLVSIETLPGPQYYEYDRSAQQLIGRRNGRTFQLGDQVHVQVVRVDLGRRTLDFLLDDSGAKKHGRGGTKRPAAERLSRESPDEEPALSGQRRKKPGSQASSATRKKALPKTKNKRQRPQ